MLAALTALTAGLALLTGRYPTPGIMNPALLTEDPLAAQLVLQLRLPRVAASLLVGATLAGCGAVLQMIFANPLVEPGLVGVSQGAAFGAVLGIVAFGGSPWVIQLAAALGAVAGLAAAWGVARRLRFGGWILRLVLSGIAVSALFSAGVGLVKFLADPLDELPEITFWLLGGLWTASPAAVLRSAPAMVIGLAVILAGRWRLNLLSLHDRVSFSLGANPRRERLILLGAATVATAAAIALAGIVGWVGLLVPHAVRRVVGADARRAIPASMIAGALFVTLADTVARTLIAGEIPLGIVTSIVGSVGFIALLASHNVRFER